MSVNCNCGAGPPGRPNAVHSRWCAAVRASNGNGRPEDHRAWTFLVSFAETDPRGCLMAFLVSFAFWAVIVLGVTWLILR